MRALMASALLILIGATLTTAEKRPDKQTYDLMGPIKVVRETIVYYDYRDGKYSELPSQEPVRAVMVFDREGMLLLSERLNSILPTCGFSISPYFDPSKRVYDSSGNLVEYMPADTLEHSSYKLKHIYDSKRRLIETEYYDPYLLRHKLLYTYEGYDEHGNWRARTVTPIMINKNYDRLQKREEYRIITYY